MTKLPIFISDKTGVSVHDIKAKAAQLIYKKNLDILYIDYLQLIEGVKADEKRNYNREQEVSKMTRALKNLAMDFEIPVVALAQLNRETEKNPGGIPQLKNLRESGAIEQDADGVAFLHRDWKVGITADPTDGHSTEFEADFIIDKWRNGELGKFKIGWNPGRMEFFDPHQSNKPLSRIAAPKHVLPEPLEHWRKPYIEGF